MSCWFKHKFVENKRVTGKMFHILGHCRGVFIFKVCEKCGKKICEFVTATTRTEVNPEYVEEFAKLDFDKEDE